MDGKGKPGSKKGTRKSAKKSATGSPKSPRSPRKAHSVANFGQLEGSEQHEQAGTPPVDHAKVLAEHIQQLEEAIAAHASSHVGASHGPPASADTLTARAQSITTRFARPESPQSADQPNHPDEGAQAIELTGPSSQQQAHGRDTTPSRSPRRQQVSMSGRSYAEYGPRAEASLASMAPIMAASPKPSPRKSAPQTKNANRPVTAKEVFEELRNMVGMAPLKLQEDVWGMRVWDVLKGDRWMQRTWCFGNSTLAEAPGLGGTAASAAEVGAGDERRPSSTGMKGGSKGAARKDAASASDQWQATQGLPTRYTSPVPLSVLEGMEFVSISAGAAHAAAASSDPRGHVYTWGSNQWGQSLAGCTGVELVAQHLLREQQSVARDPELHEVVPNLPASLLRAIEVAETRAAAAALREQGNNRMLDEAGREHAAAEAAAIAAASNDPHNPGSAHAQQVDAHLAVLKVYRITLGVRVVSVACGAAHTLAATADRGVWAWGSNTNGQCWTLAGSGQPPVACFNAPVYVSELQDVKVATVAAGGAHSAAISVHGDVWSWGDSSWGQCGTGSFAFTCAPARIKALNGKRMTAVACGYAHTLALSSAGEVYSWGINSSHQLGLQDSKERNWPVKLTHLPQCTAIAASSVSLAVSVTGRLYVWGYDRLLNPAPGMADMVLEEQAQLGGQEAEPSVGDALRSDGSPAVGGAVSSSGGGVSGGSAVPALAAAGMGTAAASTTAVTPRQVGLTADAMDNTQHVLVEPPHLMPDPSLAHLQGEGLEPLPAASAEAEVVPIPTISELDMELVVRDGTIQEEHNVLHADEQQRGLQGSGADEVLPSTGASVHAAVPQPPAAKDSWAAAPRAVPKFRRPGPPVPPKAPPPPPPPPPPLTLMVQVAASSSVPMPPPPPPLHAPLPPPPAPPAPVAAEVSLALPPLQPSSASSRMGAASCAAQSAAAATSATYAEALAKHPVVREITWVQPHKVVTVACSTRHAVVATADGRLLLWGDETSLSVQMAQHNARRISPPPAGPGALTPEALAHLAKQAAAGDVSSHESLASIIGSGATGALHSLDVPRGSALSELSFGVGAEVAALQRAGEAADTLEASASRMPREPSLADSPGFGALPTASELPGVGGASLWRLNFPGRGTGVWEVLVDGEEAAHAGNAQAGAAAGGGAQPGCSTAAGPLATYTAAAGSDTSAPAEEWVFVNINVFNGMMTVALTVGSRPLLAEASSHLSGGPSEQQLQSSAPGARAGAGTQAAHQSVGGVDHPRTATSLTAQDLLLLANNDLPELSQMRATREQLAAGLVDATGDAGWGGGAAAYGAGMGSVTGGALRQGQASIEAVGEADAVVGRWALMPPSRTRLQPGREKVFTLAAGELHTLCLCSATRYAATCEELGAVSMELVHQFATQASTRARSPPTGIRPGSSQLHSGSHARVQGAGVVGGLGLIPCVEPAQASLLPHPWCTSMAAGLYTRPCVDLDTAVLLCRQAGLMDNHTGFMDVAAGFARMLRDRSAACPPSSLLNGWEPLLGLPHPTSRPPSQAPSHTSTSPPKQRPLPGFMQSTKRSTSRNNSRNAGGAGSRSRAGSSSGNKQGADTGAGPNVGAGGENATVERARSPLHLVDAATLLFGGEVGQAGEEHRTLTIAPSSLNLESGMLSPEETVGLMCALVEDRHPAYARCPRLLLRLLCKRYMGNLQRAVGEHMAWLNARSMSSKLLMQLDSGEGSQLLHQAYVYLTYGTGPNVSTANLQPAHFNTPFANLTYNPFSATAAAMAVDKEAKGEASDLHLPLRDARRGLRRAPGSTLGPHGSHAQGPAGAGQYWVPLFRVAQFLRQAGLLPRVFSRLITELMRETEACYAHVPMAQMTPWWWPRTGRPMPTIPGGYGAFRKLPLSVDPLARPVLMAILNEFDILGVNIPKSRKIYAAALDSQMHVQLEQRKRDRMLCYVLAGAMGHWLTDIKDPDHLKPSHLMAMPVSYPQFVEAVAACAVLKCATQDERSRLTRDIRGWWPASDTAHALAGMREGIALWREKLLSPWKFTRLIHSDADLERQVDKAFSLYCTIDPMAEKVGIDAPALQRLIAECDLGDDYLTPNRLNQIFLASANQDSAKMNDFGAEEAAAKAAAARAADVPKGATDAAQWSGLTNSQMGRLARSPLALGVAKVALEGTQEEHKVEGRWVAWEESIAAAATGPRPGSPMADSSDDDASDSSAQPVSRTHRPRAPRRPPLGAASGSDIQAPGTPPLPLHGAAVAVADASGETSTGLLAVLGGSAAPEGFEAAGVRASSAAQAAASPLRASREGSGRSRLGSPGAGTRGVGLGTRRGTTPRTAGSIGVQARDGQQDLMEHQQLAQAQEAMRILEGLAAQDVGCGALGLQAQAAGSVLVRWPSFQTEDFARTPGGSRAVTPPSLSPTRSPTRTPPRSPPRFTGRAWAAGVGPDGRAAQEAAEAAVAAAAAAAGTSGSPGQLTGIVLMDDGARPGSVQAARRALPRYYALQPHSDSGAGEGGAAWGTGEQWPPVLQDIPEHGESSLGTLAGAWTSGGQTVWAAPGSAPTGGRGGVSLQEVEAGLRASLEATPSPEQLRARAQHAAGRSRSPTPPRSGSAGHATMPLQSRSGGGRTTSPLGGPRKPQPGKKQAAEAGEQEGKDGAESSSSGEWEEANGDGEAGEQAGAKDTISRLTATRTTLGGGHDSDEERRAARQILASQLEGLLLSRAQFGEALRRVAVAKYAKISSPTAAWRILIERHVLPAAEGSSSKFDTFLAHLMAPSAMATLLAWEPALRALFSTYAQDAEELEAALAAKLEAAQAAQAAKRGAKGKGNKGASAAGRLFTQRAGSLDTAGGRGGAFGQQVAVKPTSKPSTGELAMTFVHFLQLCQDRGLVGGAGGLQPRDFENVFRRVHFLDGNFTTAGRAMGYAQFVDAAALSGLYMYSFPTPKLPFASRAASLVTPEQQLDAFFVYLCGMKQPPHVGVGQPGGDALHMAVGTPGHDPYKEWWDLAGPGGTGFKPEEDSKAWSHFSSLHFKPVLIQELVVPPPPVPQHVADMLQAAAAVHNEGDPDGALRLYGEARAAWRVAAASAVGGQPVGLRTDQRLYFAVATASAHLSAGRYTAALLLYDGLKPELDRLPPGHPNAALIDSARAYALAASGRLALAYESLVAAKVARDGHPALGPTHVDTALVNHNLGCVCDMLGKTARGLELVEAAEKVFRAALGPSHPRAEVAGRNLEHMRHTCVKLEMRYHIPQPKPKPAPKADIPFGHGPRRRPVSKPEALKAAAPEAAAPKGPKLLTPQQRLAAFTLRVHSTERGAVAAGGRRDAPVRRYKKPTDPDYIGGGVYAATPDMMATWLAMKPAVDALREGAQASTAATQPPRPRTLPAPSTAPGTQVAGSSLSETRPPLLSSTAASAAAALLVGGLDAVHSGSSSDSQDDSRGPSLRRYSSPPLVVPAGAGGAKFPRIATRAPVFDASTESRKLDPKVAAAMIQAAAKQGIKLPGLTPAPRHGGSGSYVGGGAGARRRVAQEPPPRDRLGELLAPKPKLKARPKGLMGIVRQRSSSPTGVQHSTSGAHGQLGGQGEEGGDEDEEDEEDEEEDDEDEDEQDNE